MELTKKVLRDNPRKKKNYLGLCERTCPRYRTKKKNISMLDKTETLGICSNCGLQMPDQCDLLKCNNLVKTSCMSSAKRFNSDERRINLQLAKSKRLKSSSLENEKKDNLMLKIYHTKTYLHKADTKSEKSNEPDLTLPKLFNSQNNPLILPFFQQREFSDNNNVYEPLPRIKQVYSNTSLTEKFKKTHDDTFTFEFPAKYIQSKHSRVSLLKLVHNVQGKVEKGAERYQKPQVQNKTKIEKEEKLNRELKLNDSSILRDNSKKEEKTIEGDKVKLSDEKKQGDKAKLGNTTKIEDIAKLLNEATFDNKPKVKELSDTSKIEDKTKQGYTAQIEDETKQEDKTKLGNGTKIEDKANIGVKPKVDSKLALENKAKLEDKYKIGYNDENLGDKTKVGNTTKIEDIAKLVNEETFDNKPKLNEILSDKSKIEEKTKQGYTGQIEDETKQEDKTKLGNGTKIEDKANIGAKPKLDSKFSLENKAKLEDKYRIGYNDEKLGDYTKLGNITKTEDIVKIEEVHLRKVHTANREKQELNKIKNEGYPPSVQTSFLIENDNMNTLIELGEKHDEMKKTANGSEFEKQSLSPLPSLESHNDDSIIIDYSYDKKKILTDFIIIGNKIYNYTKPKTKQGSLPQDQTKTRKPTLYDTPSISKKENHKREKSINPVEADRKGVLRFALSNPKFVDMGWTKLPTQKVVRKLNVYRMRPSHPEYDWFTKNKDKKQMRYDSGETLALFDDDGSGRWFYRNGNLALDYYNAEESNANQRYVVYSSEETDERGRSQPRTVLATFDHLGNGIIFDHSGKVRLKYDQNEGIVLDRSIGPKSHWKWHALNDPPVLQNVFIDTQLQFKDPRITRLSKHRDDTEETTESCEDMLAIEFNNFIREKRKKICQSYKPYQIRMKALKINQYFSLKILDQATIYLIYRDGKGSIKLNIGMKLDPTEILHSVSCDLSDIFNTMERFPADTESITTMQRIVQQAKDAERARVLHDRRLRPLAVSASADLLRTGLSLRRQPLVTYSAPDMNMVPCDPVEAHDCGSMSSVISKPCSF